jgi:hypothetical protein
MQDPFVGTWKLNPEKCDFDANHRPTGATMVFDLDEQGYYLMKAHGTNAKGEKVAERPQKFRTDGQEHPVPDIPALKATASKPDPNTITAEVKREDGSPVGGGSYVVSADGKSLTATTFGYDAQLRQFKQQTVWDRQ